MDRETLAVLVADPERIAQLGVDAIPALLGEVETLRARLWARLQAASAVRDEPPRESRAQEPDRLLTASEAGARLGVGKRWMYRHAGSLPFTRRLSGGTLRFSLRGLQRWQESRALRGGGS